MKLRSSVGSNVELRTRRTNQRKQTKSNFIQTRLNIRYHTNFISCFVACEGRRLSRRGSSDVQTFFRSRRIERVGRSKPIQTNLSEPDVELFIELNSLSLVRLMKRSTFGLGLRWFPVPNGTPSTRKNFHYTFLGNCSLTPPLS